MYLAIEIGGSKLQLCAGSLQKGIVERRRFEVERAAGAEGIRAHMLSVLPELIATHRPRVIGVGYGGPVDIAKGSIIKSYHIAGWDGFPLAGWLREQTNLATFIENDTNAAAYGEAVAGAGKGSPLVFYTNLGSGVGGGFIQHGQLFRSPLPGEMEFGHLRLSPDGTIVEDRCSGWAVDRRIREEIARAPGSLLARLVDGEGGEARHLAAALEAGDELAHRILHEVARDFAFALSHVVHLLHPTQIVIGGGLAKLGEPLRASLEQALPGFVMDAMVPPPPIALTAFGEDAVPMGVLALAERSCAPL